MTTVHNQPLSTLLSKASTISDETLSAFGHLTAQQLNWKPGAEQWSIAQCFDHLVTANQAYFPTFEKVLSGEQESTFWERLPVLPSLCGKLVIRAVAPETRRKRKNPTIFNPSSSNIEENIIRRFLSQQNDIVGYMKTTKKFDLEKIKISSPVSPLITYSLMDAYRIIVAHEERHLLQARRMADMAGFPKDIP